jgi:acetyl-CoA acyltransferase
VRDAYVISVGMIQMGRHVEQSVKQLTAAALDALFKDSPVQKPDLQAAWFSNSGWGLGNMEQGQLPTVAQPCIRGQVALSPAGIDGIPIMNVENACASGSSAFYGAYLGVLSGVYDVALAVGVEKMALAKDAPKEAQKKSLGSFLAGTDVEAMLNVIELLKAESEKRRKEAEARGEARGPGRENRSPFMDFYSFAARAHMEKYGTTQEQLAIIAAKNHNHGALNPYAQYRFQMTPEQVMQDDIVSFPLTRAMCAPTGDGAAAAIIVSGDYLRRHALAGGVKIRASVLGSTKLSWSGGKRARALAQECYDKAGVGPADISFAEVHDATAFGELVQYENLGFCAEGQGGAHAASGASTLGGRQPVNPCGGLESKGHPIGATGLAMVAECFFQLRGQAGARQVEGARLAMIENGGGFLGQGEAAIVMSILEAPAR